MFSPLPTRPPFLVSALLAAAAFPVTARADGVAEVEALRAAHRMESAKATQPLREGFAKALAQLERRMAARGDYENAAKVRAARLDAESGGASPAAAAAMPAAAKDGSFSLKAEAAETAGGVTLDRASGTLGGWAAAGALARWRLPAGLSAGGYEVELTFTAPGDCAGEVTVRGTFHSLKRTWKPTAAATSPRTEILGTLRIKANTALLEFSPAFTSGAAAFQLHSVRLIPAAGQS